MSQQQAFNLNGSSGGVSGSGFIQQVHFSSANLASSTSQIAANLSTIPSSTDGTQWTTLTLTQKVAASLFLVEGMITLSVVNAQAAQIAIFDGVSSTAKATYYQDVTSAEQILNMPFSFYYTPASLTTYTFSLRYGATNAGGSPVTAINGNAATGTAVQVGNGANFSTFKITEISPIASNPFQISITDNDDVTITASAFTIVGVRGFNFLWNSGDSQFQIIPPNTFVHNVTVISGTSVSMVAGNSYILSNASLTSASLPSSASTVVGDLIEIISLDSPFHITQAASQQIFIGEAFTTSGTGGFVDSSGSLQNAIQLRCVIAADPVAIWVAASAPQGSFICN